MKEFPNKRMIAGEHLIQRVERDQPMFCQYPYFHA
jgi:hypothetical protein